MRDWAKPHDFTLVGRPVNLGTNAAAITERLTHYLADRIDLPRRHN